MSIITKYGTQLTLLHTNALQLSMNIPFCNPNNVEALEHERNKPFLNLVLNHSTKYSQFNCMIEIS